MPSQITRDDAQSALSQVLLENVRRDTYPSTTQMDMLEEVLPPELAGEYVNVLLEKIMSSRWPSISLLRRLERLVY